LVAISLSADPTGVLSANAGSTTPKGSGLVRRDGVGDVENWPTSRNSGVEVATRGSIARFSAVRGPPALYSG
jgi:hypothetical protein